MFYLYKRLDIHANKVILIDRNQWKTQSCYNKVIKLYVKMEVTKYHHRYVVSYSSLIIFLRK